MDFWLCSKSVGIATLVVVGTAVPGAVETAVVCVVVVVDDAVTDATDPAVDAVTFVFLDLSSQH